MDPNALLCWVCPYRHAPRLTGHAPAVRRLARWLDHRGPSGVSARCGLPPQGPGMLDDGWVLREQAAPPLGSQTVLQRFAARVAVRPTVFSASRRCMRRVTGL